MILTFYRKNKKSSKILKPTPAINFCDVVYLANDHSDKLGEPSRWEKSYSNLSDESMAGQEKYSMAEKKKTSDNL